VNEEAVTHRGLTRQKKEKTYSSSSVYNRFRKTFIFIAAVTEILQGTMQISSLQGRGLR
jgi:hypothetical protein